MVRILNIGDTHFRGSPPINRRDDFFEGQLKKFTWCCIQACVRECDAIVIPGDIFDMPFVGNYCLQRVQDVISSLDLPPIYVIYGQHDLYLRNKRAIGKTSLKVVESARLVTMLSSKPVRLGGIALYGASFEDAIPEIKDHSAINVLVVHDMISNVREPFKYKKPRMFAKYGYDAVISGDNHKTFIVRVGDMLHVNIGAMSRLKISEYNHVPKVAIINVDRNVTVDTLRIKPAMPPEVVFRERPTREVDLQDFSGEIDALIDELGAFDWDPIDPIVVLERHLNKFKKSIRKGAIDKLAGCLVAWKEKEYGTRGNETESTVAD